MKISVVIPAYNEADIISTTIRTVQQRSNSIHEIIVVDGGSSDQTVGLAKKGGARVVISPGKGRAHQMNYGARQASGEILYFLHADSLPPLNFDRKIKRAFPRGYTAGCFQLAFDSDSVLLDIYAWFTRFDVDAFRFGDQSLFISREAFWDVGGFREDHLVMEDNEIVCRIKRHFSFTILDDKVETSARAYERGGVFRLQLVFLIIVILYHCGVRQEVLGHIKKRALK